MNTGLARNGRLSRDNVEILVPSHKYPWSGPGLKATRQSGRGQRCATVLLLKSRGTTNSGILGQDFGTGKKIAGLSRPVPCPYLDLTLFENLKFPLRCSKFSKHFWKKCRSWQIFHINHEFADSDQSLKESLRCEVSSRSNLATFDCHVFVIFAVFLISLDSTRWNVFDLPRFIHFDIIVEVLVTWEKTKKIRIKLLTLILRLKSL